jgi:hypothetical protein
VTLTILPFGLYNLIIPAIFETVSELNYRFMKTTLYPLIVLFLFFSQTPILFSQNQTDISQIIIGKNYKIILFDDTEIFGKVTAADSSSVTVVTENKSTIIIPRGNILYYSTEMAPSKYKYAISLLGGVSLLSGDNYNYYSYSNSTKIAPNFNLAGMFFLSDTKAIKIDAGYTYIKAKYDNNLYPGAPYYYQTTYEGGNISYFSFKGNILFGRFIPDERIIYYFSVGFGLHLTSQQDITEHYYTQNYPDTTYVPATRILQNQSEVNALLSIGGSVGYRITKKFGVKLEMEYNLITGNYFFLFFGGRNYFPLRAGVFYVF